MIAKYNFLPEARPLMDHPGCVEITHDWHFWVGGVTYWIPMWYFMDGASIPRIFWILIGSPFEPDFWAAALAHDWIYFTHVLSRDKADEIFYQFLISAGVSRWKARVMWAAVRTGGYFAWKNDKNDELLLFQLKREIAKRPDHDKFILEAQ